MRFKAKHNLIFIGNDNEPTSNAYLIRKDNIYKGEYTPKMYNPNTFQYLVSLIIVCEDGLSRRFDTDNFYSLEEWREIQLDSILD
jgi:hypothetical protein